MKTHRIVTGGTLLLLALVVTGCQSSAPRRRPGALASNEPGLDAVPGSRTEGGTAVVEAPPARTMTFVDRHPLFSKPREYYNSSGENPVVKGAAATIVGIPVGVFGEMKQIVAGRPTQDPTYQ